MIHVPFFWPARPENWPDDDWPPDCAFPLIQAGLLAGKSIGFLPLKVHAPTAGEIDKNPQLERFTVTLHTHNDHETGQEYPSW